MLKSLSIINYALIERTEASFGAGLNIVTGETGAGKSIFVGALGLLLGDRASSDLIRKGENKAIVEGVFDVADRRDVLEILERGDLDAADELIVRRELSRKGANRNFVNDSPAPLTVVKALGDRLVDLHGQHEHQSLLRQATHVEFLDAFADAAEPLARYREARRALRAKTDELAELREREATLKERKEFYEFQLKEIDRVDPTENEDEEIEAELSVLENAERLFEAAANAFRTTYDDDRSAYNRLNEAREEFEEAARFDPAFAERLEELDSAIALVESVANFARDYRGAADLDPRKLDALRERAAELSRLKKKYGGELATVFERRDEMRREVELATDFEANVGAIVEDIERRRGEASAAAKRLSEIRRGAAKNLSEACERALATLGLEGATFETTISTIPAADDDADALTIDGAFVKSNARGCDEVEFLLSANAGEDAKPLAKVASGGEVSRIMLALKSVLARANEARTLIFDEIDVGVSGRIARKVGETLRDLSTREQVLAITHLPQIAGLADAHYAVEKVEQDGRTVSRLRKLTDDERVREVAKLLSGETITDSALESARDLIGKPA
jgi:DNA repair protein RecN (Recombination protein N)